MEQAVYSKITTPSSLLIGNYVDHGQGEAEGKAGVNNEGFSEQFVY